MSLDEPVVRARRRDATRNGERIVQAAREVFARQGLSATLEDIARHAGVGVGTVYRNFGSKREIVETLYDESLASILTGIHTATQIEDPWLAIVAFFEGTAEAQARDRGLCELFLARDSSGLGEATTAELVAGLTSLFDRATAAGVLRDGVSVTDVWPIFAMLYGIYAASDEHPELWRRYLALLLDGLRAADRPALPVTALDVVSFTAALSTGG